MRIIRKHLDKLQNVERKSYHPLIHKIHRKYHISRRTLFYVKEYGKRSHVASIIIKESIFILLLASIISSFGGLALERIKEVFILIIPLIILLPVLNSMIGGYGAIFSSRFSTMLHEGKIKSDVWKNKELRKMCLQIFTIALIMSFFSASAALIISHFSNYPISIDITLKIFLIVILDVLLLTSILFFVSVSAGLYFYKKNEDPNNFLIPITTSIADFGNMLILSILILLFF